MRKILQMIPAVGWHAVFVERGEASEAELYSIPLCCWALVEQDDAGDIFRFISGFGATDVIDTCDDVRDFVGYLHESEPEGIEKYSEDAQRHLRWLERRKREEGAV
jgi:hypothetical protein